jgi:hypothetical protein
MSNMSYCRFENTYRDLLDCYHALQDSDSFPLADSDMSESEGKAMHRLIELCGKIVDTFSTDDSDL